jgi:hypothetical protein
MESPLMGRNAKRIAQVLEQQQRQQQQQQGAR